MKTILLTIMALLFVVTPDYVWAIEYEGLVITDATLFGSQGESIWADQIVGYAFPKPAGSARAALWHSHGESMTILHPASGYSYSWAWDVHENQQVGNADKVTSSGARSHAMLWEGTAASAVDLHPAGFDQSYADAVSCGKQGGTGFNLSTMVSHALIWTGSAQSVMDLHPAGFTSSRIRGMTCDQQVGTGRDSNGYDHALLWSGTAQSVVDLHPEQGYQRSVALSVYANRQVGYAYIPSDVDFDRHAMLWYGSAGSAVDLNPSYCTESIAYGTSRHIQVGSGVEPGPNSKWHAFLWTGSAESAVDLHSALPSGYVGSGAFGINTDGHIVGWAGTEMEQYLAIWIPVLCPFILEGDLNSDCEVDFRDFALMAQSWLKDCEATPNDPACVPRH